MLQRFIKVTTYNKNVTIWDGKVTTIVTKVITLYCELSLTVCF